MDKVFIEGMSFFAKHGVLPAEREIGQKFLVDVVLFLDLAPAGNADDLEQAVDYLAVYREVEKVVCGRSYRLLETLAEAVAAAVMEAFPVNQVGVRVKKPGAPLPGCFDSVGVEITRTREQCPSG
ncbi:MAG: dihydroneopterin aldolase [Ammonifex sp.]|jgi:dihydroneopterin aldolase|nr:MAG: dihydroneopterin aldolase [Ammonifex sp.]